MSRWDDMRKRLQDLFQKAPDSNIAKLLRLAAEPMDEIEEVLWLIDAWRDLDTAEGTTLDAIGSNVGQPRGGVGDPIYRALIRSKIARNLSTGTIDSIIDVLSLALNSSPDTIRLVELSSDIVTTEPAAFRITEVPLARLNEMGMSSLQFVQLTKSVAPLAVRVDYVSFSGTFRFSNQNGVVESTAEGFSNIAGSSGGTIGNVYEGGNVPDLPV
ncbi:DUF2612 domain-containing protein [Paenibacillus periandrae]|uniref:DUF2612 domain-containing protein n=1 Tax=Paenibacillus periandrae TaxID=1761741 RepID=UPI001F08BE71|nr:DUF2612 domain-containing protein [Paenibacillus periandrae]